MKKSSMILPFLFALLFLTFWGCDKEEHTRPVDFNLYFEVDEKPVMDGNLTIESILISLVSIDIEGQREVGEDVFLTRKFDEREIIGFTIADRGNIISFNLPQGIYNPLSFMLNLTPDSEEEDIYEDFDEWHRDIEEGSESIEDLEEDLGDIIEDYLDDVRPCILVKAKYERNDIFFNVIFAFNDPVMIRIRARNAEGGTEVSLSKDRLNEGVIVLDPSYWFSAVSPLMLESAFPGTLDEEKYIFLHKEVNFELFTSIYNRFEESAVMFIKE